jgi:hypothetical protein
MNDSIFCGFSVPLVAAIIFSLTHLPNCFYRSPTSGIWDSTICQQIILNQLLKNRA